MPIKRQREYILMAPFSKQEALRLLHLPPIPLPVLSSFLSSPSSPPPPVCSRRLPLTAGDAADRWALTARAAGSGRWAVVTSAVVPGPASPPSPRWRGVCGDWPVSMVTGLSEAVGLVREETPVRFLAGAGKCWRHMMHYRWLGKSH